MCWQAECGAGLGERREEESAREEWDGVVCVQHVCVKKRRARAVAGGDEGMAVEACVLGSVERSAQESAVERREVRRWREREEKGELSGFAQSRMSINEKRACRHAQATLPALGSQQVA